MRNTTTILRIFGLALLMALIFFNQASGQSAGGHVTWTTVGQVDGGSNETAIWQGKIWMLDFDQETTPGLQPTLWNSDNGISWTQVVDLKQQFNFPIDHIFVFRDQLWLAGRDGQILNSPDGLNWTKVADAEWG